MSELTPLAIAIVITAIIVVPIIGIIRLEQKVNRLELEIDRIKRKTGDNGDINKIKDQHNGLIKKLMHERRLFPKLGQGSRAND